MPHVIKTIPATAETIVSQNLNVSGRTDSRLRSTLRFATPHSRRLILGIGLAALIHGVNPATAADWVRGGVNTNQPVWGLRGGVQFALPPGGFTGGDGGPRGLIRIGYPTLTNGGYDLINFIALEPVVGGVRGYSELEKSHFDGHQGKLFWTGRTGPITNASAAYDSGSLTKPEPGVEILTLTVQTEKFDNGAHVRLVLSQRSDRPDELCITIRTEPDSAPIETCILTATMGNKSRARLLWLKDETVSSSKLFGDYRGEGFAPQVVIPIARLPRATNGDVLIAISNDEQNPSLELASENFWKYGGEKVTQYWRKPAAGLNDSLRCAVNARFTYWMSKNPIPGGLAFENFELVEAFKDGQEDIFGVTKRAPSDLGQTSKRR
jgi:hypothetical protein